MRSPSTLSADTTKRWKLVSLMLTLLLAMLFCPPRAAAVQILLDFESILSDEPSFDSDGSRLQAMFTEAALYWQDIFPHESWELTVRFWYDDLDGGTLGEHLNLSTDDGKPDRCRIKIDWRDAAGADRLWYFDETPTNHSEFDMVQTLARDLTPVQRTDFYNGTPNDLLEVSFAGDARATAPAAAQNGHDLFSVVLHEMGHALGMTDNVASGEVGDNDYDFHSDLIWGETTAADCFNGTDVYHLAAGTLMFPNIGTGRRRLPSATDVFSIQTTANWGTNRADILRKDFYSTAANANFNQASLWEGNVIPSTHDDAFVRHGNNATVSAFVAVRSLTVDEGSTVFIGANRFCTGDTCRIGTNGNYARVDIDGSGGEIESPIVIVDSNAELTLNNGALVDANEIVLQAGSLLSGRGTVDVADEFFNDGIVQTNNGGVLTLTSASGFGVFNLDGSGSGEVSVTGGSLVIDGYLTDAFSSRIRVGSGYSLRFNHGWELDSSGVLDLDGGSATTSTVAGTTSDIAGRVNVNGSNCWFDTAVTFAATAAVRIPNATSELNLYNQTTYNGGSYTGLGALVQQGNAIVMENTIIDVATFDWDGFLDDSNMNLLANLTINSNRINAGPSNSYSGELVMLGSTLEVNTDNIWRLNGSMTLGNSEVRGQMLSVYGEIHESPFFVGTSSTIYPALRLMSGATITVDSNCELTLQGTTEYLGGTVEGGGTLIQNGDMVVGNVIYINVDVFDMDGTSGTTTVTVDSSTSLVINSSKIDTSDPVSDGFDGTLNLQPLSQLAVNTTDPWRLDGTLNMDGSDGVSEVVGSEIVVVGHVNVAGGTTYLRCPARFTSSAQVAIEAGAELDLRGRTTFEGGAYTGDGTLQQTGNASVVAVTTIAVDQYDMDGSAGNAVLVLDDHLTLDVEHVETGSNVFNGTLTINNPGRLIVHTPDAWTMAGTMNLNQNAHANQYYVTGSDVNITGTVNVDGQAGIGAKIDLSGTISLPDAGDLIQFGTFQDNTLSGGQITGDGTIFAAGGSFAGHGRIEADVNFTLGADLLAENGVLTVSGALVEVDVIGTGNAAGTLDVPYSWNTSAATRLELDGGGVTGVGSTLNNDGLTQGHGEIAPTAFLNNGTLRADGGTLVLKPQGTCDLDGTDPDGSGVIEAVNGDVLVKTDFSSIVVFNGQLTVGAGRQFRMECDGLRIAQGTRNGRLTLRGGTYTAPLFQQASKLVVETLASTIDAQSTFLDGGMNQLDAGLRLRGSAYVEVGAQFTGSGDSHRGNRRHDDPGRRRGRRRGRRQPGSPVAR